MKGMIEMIPKEIMAKAVDSMAHGCDPSQRICDIENARECAPFGEIDCKECNNKGYILRVVGGESVMETCACVEARKALRRMEESGLGDSLKKLTFDSYIATEDWQRTAKALAEKYANEGEGAWFFIGGQSGSGKTHLCTAISGKLLRDGKAVKYMRWRDEAAVLKAAKNDGGYGGMMDALQKADVLYVDDFLKTQQRTDPSSADMGLAFEILNYRVGTKKMTIISTERSLKEICDLDEAVGGRIFDMSRGFCLTIANDRAKNFRMRTAER